MENTYHSVQFFRIIHAVFSFVSIAKILFNVREYRKTQEIKVQESQKNKKSFSKRKPPVLINGSYGCVVVG